MKEQKKRFYGLFWNEHWNGQTLIAFSRSKKLLKEEYLKEFSENGPLKSKLTEDDMYYDFYVIREITDKYLK